MCTLEGRATETDPKTMKGFADPGVIKNISTIPDDKINAVYDALADMLATVKAAA